MIEKNSDICGTENIVYCIDCREEDRGICKRTDTVVRMDFFCKNGVRKKEPEPEKEITRDEKLDAIIEHIEVGYDFSRPLYFRRNLSGKGIYLYPCRKES